MKTFSLFIALFIRDGLFYSIGLLSLLFSLSEAYIGLAVLRLVEEEKCVVEGAGATGLAAALAGKLSHLKGKRLVKNTFVLLYTREKLSLKKKECLIYYAIFTVK